MREILAESLGALLFFAIVLIGFALALPAVLVVVITSLRPKPDPFFAPFGDVPAIPRRKGRIR